MLKVMWKNGTEVVTTKGLETAHIGSWRNKKTQLFLSCSLDTGGLEQFLNK